MILELQLMSQLQSAKYVKVCTSREENEFIFNILFTFLAKIYAKEF